jgi:site-specific DNA recombinase
LTGDFDDTGDMFRKFIGIVNEYQSKETSRCTMRTMKANARLGYSNGDIIPFGYKSVGAEVIGKKQKKKLAIEPVGSGDRNPRLRSGQER